MCDTIWCHINNGHALLFRGSHMSWLMRILAARCIAMLLIASSQAANIHYEAGNGINLISIEGEIVHGDADRFDQIVPAVGFSTAVFLNSKGGSVMEGLMIGEAIRTKGYATAVVNGAECASTCGLIWLAGATRYVGRTGNIGFHAAYTGTGDDAKEAGAANAIVGAYLTKLGLSYEAVLFATSAPPDEIRWLHPDDAQKVGIQCITLPDPEPEGPRPAPSARVAQALPDGSAIEHQAMNLVLSYYAFWSKSGIDLDGLDQYYGDTVVFYGSSVPSSKVMDEKRKFSARWPIRNYTVRASTLFAQCSDTCSVTGVVEWDVSSVERGAHSVGAANFVLKIAPNSSEIGGVILSENGSVLSSHTDSLPSVPQVSAPVSAQPAPNLTMPANGSATMAPEQQAASTTTAYADGRQARIDSERWVASLQEGPYRDGVLFWASNRSLKSPPSCAPMGSLQEWQQGCSAARARFAIIDSRRKTEKNYWWGWNSL
jgi:hypothetical protein